MTQGTYRTLSLALAVAFGLVGAAFLFLSNGIISFFNDLSVGPGMTLVAPDGPRLYVILTVGYMYCVTLLAWLMYRFPAVPVYPRLLAGAKLVSAGLSFGFCIVESVQLVLLVNGVVDGAIALLAAVMARYSVRGTP